MERQTKQRKGLARRLSRLDLSFLGINQIIGSGIFVLPATVVVLVGAGLSPVVWAFAAVINLLIVLCFAEAATHFREAGGPYLYARSVFGPYVGFQVAWIIWITRVTTQAALANAFTLYAGYFWEGAVHGIHRILLLIALIGALAVINLRGVRSGALTVNLLAAAKLVPLLIFVAAGCWFIDWSLFQVTTNPGFKEIGRATLLLMFAFGGFELISLPAGEAKAPRKDIPLAFLGAIAIVASLYLAIQFVAVGTLPGIESSLTPLSDAGEHFLGSFGGILIALGGLLAILGTNAGTMLAGPRISFAMAEKRELPALLGHVHPRFRTPDVSIACYAVTSLVLALSGSFVQLATLSAIARLLFYVTTCAAVPFLRRKTATTRRPYIPAGVLVPVLAVLFSLTILTTADLSSMISALVALLVGTLLFWIFRSRRKL